MEVANEKDFEDGWIVKNDENNQLYFTDNLISFGVDQYHLIDFAASNWKKISVAEFRLISSNKINRTLKEKKLK